MRDLTVFLISAAFPPQLGGVATHVTDLAHGLLSEANVRVLTTAKNESYYKNGGLVVWKLPIRRCNNWSGQMAPLQEVVTFAIRNFRNKVDADIIHAHDLQSAYIGWMLKIAFKRPLVITIHRAPTAWKKHRYRESAKDCFMEGVRLNDIADRLVVPSNTSKAVLLEQGFQEDMIKVIPHGINYKYLSSFSDMDTVKNILPVDRDKLILCVARSDGHKDPSVFIRAATILKNQNPKGLFFVVTADVSDVFPLETLAKSAGLDVGRDIIFRTFEWKEMATLYRLAVVCVVPSLHESFGLSVLESFVFRTPVVVSNASGLKEIVDHEVTGLQFNLGDHEDLASQVQRLIEDNTFATNLAANAFEKVEDYYNTARMTYDHVDLYEEVK